jgi:hypothetical protein
MDAAGKSGRYATRRKARRISCWEVVLGVRPRENGGPEQAMRVLRRSNQPTRFRGPQLGAKLASHLSNRWSVSSRRRACIRFPYGQLLQSRLPRS